MLKQNEAKEDGPMKSNGPKGFLEMKKEDKDQGRSQED